MRFSLAVLFWKISAALALMGQTSPQQNSLQEQSQWPDISAAPFDLIVPLMDDGRPAPGKRVRVNLPGYDHAGVYHALYLPRDWVAGKRFPVIVEYAGNGPYRNKYGDVSDGTVEGAVMGYGLSGGEGYIWLSLPCVDAERTKNQVTWWGDVPTTLSYCREAIDDVVAHWGGDRQAVLLAGFSRGAIACNYLGLQTDAAAAPWRAFFAHSHYDGVRRWNFDGSDRTSALERLSRLRGRPVWVSHEAGSAKPGADVVVETRAYLESTGIDLGSFTFKLIPIRNHTGAWLLQDRPERAAARAWLRRVMEESGTSPQSGRMSTISITPVESRVDEIEWVSHALAKKMKATVIHPGSDEKPSSRTQVLWLLHGRGRDHRSLLQLPEVKHQLLASGFWVVLPQGEDGWYVNSPERVEERYEDHLSELMQVVAAHYALPSSGDDWTLAGWSMGGYGAVHYAQQHPERVGRVASVIGLLDFPRPETLPEGQNYRVPQARFGTQPETWATFNPMRSIEKLRTKSLLLITAREAFDRTMNENFSHALKDADIPHRFLILEGAHTLDVVEKAIPILLEWIAQPREASVFSHPSTLAPTAR